MPPGDPATEPKLTLLTDPAATWTNKGQMKITFAYGCNYLTDLRAAAIIVNVQATLARWSAEVAVTKTMLARTETRFGLKPDRLAADAAYGSGLMIGWLMQREITPHIPILAIASTKQMGCSPAPSSPSRPRRMCSSAPEANC